jgi:hypothetical protein
MNSARLMHIECCPTCGQPKLTGDLLLPPIKQRIYDIVSQRPGISAERLRELVWTGPDGGPENRKCLHVHISQLNGRLAPFGITIRGSTSRGYEVRPL